MAASKSRGLQFWSSNAVEYMHWLCLSPKLRGDIQTEAELARRMGIDQDNFIRWRRRPDWEAAKAAKAIEVQLGMDVEYRKAQTDNMLKPEGWQERIAYYRYQFKDMLIAKESGALDYVSREQFTEQDNRVVLTEEEVRLQLSQEPVEIQNKFIAYLTGLDRLRLSEPVEIGIGDRNNAGIEGHPTDPPALDRFQTEYIIPDNIYEREAAGPRATGEVVRKNRNGAGGKRERSGNGPQDIASDD